MIANNYGHSNNLDTTKVKKVNVYQVKAYQHLGLTAENEFLVEMSFESAHCDRSTISR